MTAGPAAGWYDDPERDGQLRWWDGSEWSSVRRPKGQQHAAAAVHTRWGSGEPDASAAVHGRASEPQPATSELATPGQRLAAAVLDVLVGFAILVVAGLVGFVAQVLPGALEVLVAGVVSIAVWVLPIGLTVMGTGRLGQSYGKHVVGIAVVAADTGRPIGSPAALGREIVRSIGAYVFGLGLLWILWDPQRQGWHDKAVGSVVVTRPGRNADPLTFLRAIVDNDPTVLMNRP